MSVASLSLEGKDDDDQSYIEFLDTHNGLTVWVHQCYEQLGIDLKVSEAILLKEYLEKYIETYQELTNLDE